MALVTGGNGGIGLGDGAGDGVVRRVDRDRRAQCGEGGPALASLRELGVRCAFIAGDVTKKAACVKLVADTVAEFGRLDILVNNAGTAIRKMPQDYTEEEWHLVMDTNLTSAFLCSQAAYAPMKAAGGGKMINIGSMMSLFGAPYATPYASSKGGIVQMTRAMATAWAKDNIQVNAVLPGWIDTDLTRRARREVAGLHERVENRTPAGRWGVAAGHGGDRGVPRQPGVGFRDGDGDPGGRRVFDRDVARSLRRLRRPTVNTMSGESSGRIPLVFSKARGDIAMTEWRSIPR